MKTLFLLTAIALVQPAFAAKEEKVTNPAVYTLVDEAAKLLNSPSGITGIKKISGMEKSLKSEDDKAYLKSIAGNRLLPKGHEAVSVLDSIFITNKKRNVIAGFQVIGLNPLELKGLDGKIFKVDRQNIRGSLPSAGGHSDLGSISETFASIFIAQAHADELSADVAARLEFVLGLIEQQASNDHPRDPNRATRVANERKILAREAFAKFGFNANVGCTGSFSEVLISRNNYKTYITADDLGKTVSCSKKPPTHPGVVARLFRLHDQAVPGSWDTEEKCIFSPTQSESFSELEKREKKLTQDFENRFAAHSVRTSGKIKLEGGKCSYVYHPNQQPSLAELNSANSEANEFCRGDGKENKEELFKVRADLKNRQDFALSLFVNKAPLYFVSRAINECCGDNECRVKAQAAGWKLGKENLPDINDDSAPAEGTSAQ